MTPDAPNRQPGLLRLIGSVLYDWLVLLGLLILAGFIPVALNKWFTGADSIASGNPLFFLWNLAIIHAYFIGFWLTKRQTVGMRAWRLHIEPTNGRPLGWQHGLLRFWAALPAWGLLLAGVLARYLDSERRTWADRASWTTLVYTPRKPKH